MKKHLFFTILGCSTALYSGMLFAADEPNVIELDKPKFSPHAYINDDTPNITSFLNVDNKKVKEENAEIHFSADEMETDRQNELIIAKGDVNIVRETLTLKADKVIYNQKSDLITAVGNVIVLEESGDVVFTDRIELADKMTKGQMNNIKVIMKDKSRIYASSAKLLENKNKVMRNVVYSPCDVCCENKDPLWQIRARKVTHNAEKRDIDYKSATLEVKGVPVFYVPYMSHPDPTVKRRSGFLAPTLGSNSYLGASIQPKYFFNISDQEDLTLSPILSTDVGFIPSASYRKYFYSGELNVEGSVLKDEDRDETRGHLNVLGRYEIDDYWVSSVDFNYISDRTYLKDLSLPKRSDAWLPSNAKIEGFDNRNYAAVEAYYYKLISHDIPKLDKPYVVPLMSYENISDPMAYGSYVKTNLDFASVLRDEETNSQRMTMINYWILPYTSPFGEKYRLQASVKSDLYYVDNYIDQDDEGYSGATGRVMPQLGLEWKLPFVSPGENFRQILEPTVVAVAAPNAGNGEKKIPNEDSLYQELDDTNILSLDRYTGYDRNDTGSRVSYGMNWSAYGDKTGRTSAFIAQTYNFTQDESFPANSVRQPDSNFSDYVGRVYAAPNPYIDLSYRFRMDRENYELKYSELAANVGPEILNAYVAYIYLQEDANSVVQGYEERKELYTALKSRITRDWSIDIYNRQDLTKGGGSLEYGGSLTYEDECLKIITNARRDNSKDPDYDNGFEVSVTFLLKTLGGIDSK